MLHAWFFFLFSIFLVADRMFIWPEAIHDLLKHKIKARDTIYTYYLKSIEYIKWSIRHSNFYISFLLTANRSLFDIKEIYFTTYFDKKIYLSYPNSFVPCQIRNLYIFALKYLFCPTFLHYISHFTFGIFWIYKTYNINRLMFKVVRA